MTVSRFALAVALLAATCATASSTSGIMAFELFKAKFNKSYTSKADESLRRQVYEANMVRAADLAKRNPHAVFGATPFADMSPEEFRAKFLTMKREKEPSQGFNAISERHEVASSTADSSSGSSTPPSSPYPSTVDWRKEGAVTRVPNQGQCGNGICSFGLVTVVEGLHKIVNGELITLSAQEGMACFNIGCGCDFHATWEWYLKNQSGNVMTNASIPYNGVLCENSVCNLTGGVIGAKFDKIIRIEKTELAMTEWTAKGPIAVAVDATSWQTYISGVMTDCTYNQVDHVAGIVGYNDDTFPSYWIVKNWWSTAWGEDGYILLGKGTNQCGLTYEPLTVLVPPA